MKLNAPLLVLFTVLCAGISCRACVDNTFIGIDAGDSYVITCDVTAGQKVGPSSSLEPMVTDSGAFADEEYSVAVRPTGGSCVNAGCTAACVCTEMTADYNTVTTYPTSGSYQVVIKCLNEIQVCNLKLGIDMKYNAATPSPSNNAATPSPSNNAATPSPSNNAATPSPTTSSRSVLEGTFVTSYTEYTSSNGACSGQSAALSATVQSKACVQASSVSSEFGDGSLRFTFYSDNTAEMDVYLNSNSCSGTNFPRVFSNGACLDNAITDAKLDWQSSASATGVGVLSFFVMIAAAMLV